MLDIKSHSFKNYWWVSLSIVAIGSDIGIETLKIIGAKILTITDVRDEEELSKVYGSVINSKAVLIEDNLYRVLKADLENIISSLPSPPLIIVVPSFTVHETSRLREIHNKVSLAVGVKLKW